MLFLEGIGDIGSKQKTAEFIINSINPAIMEGLSEIVAERRISKEYADELAELFRYNITGLMLYYTNRRYPPDYPGLMKAVGSQIELILSLPTPGKN